MPKPRSRQRWQQFMDRRSRRRCVTILFVCVSAAAPAAATDENGAGIEERQALEEREAIAEQRLEEMLEATPAAGTPGPAGADGGPAVDAGRFPQIRVPLGGATADEPEMEVEVAPNPPPAPAADPVPPPHDADERGLDPLID